MEKWYAVYDKNTKALVSTGTTVASGKLPENLAVIELPEIPDFGTSVWDKDNLRMKPRPVEVVVIPVDPLGEVKKKLNDLMTVVQAIGKKVGA